VHINEVSKRLYPRISRNPNFGTIFLLKKCSLSTGKYGTSGEHEMPLPKASHHEHVQIRKEPGQVLLQVFQALL